MTRFAPTRLTPSPPTRVVNRKRNVPRLLATICALCPHRVAFFGRRTIVELIDELLSGADRCVPIHSQIGVTLFLYIRFENVEHLLRLREHERLVALDPPLGQNVVQHPHFTGAVEGAVVFSAHCRWQVVLEKIRMIANLAQHTDRLEASHAAVDNPFNLLRAQVPVVLSPLLWRQPAEKHLFRLFRQLRRHRGLEAAQQVRLDEPAKDRSTAICHLHLHSSSISVPADVYRLDELRFKKGQGAQQTRVDKVEQRPQLAKIVLHGGARQEQSCTVRTRLTASVIPVFGLRILWPSSSTT